MSEASKARPHPKHALAAEALRAGHTLRLRAQGTSMLPSIWPGDLLTVFPAGGIDPQVGDIVLVGHEDRFVIHRLIETQEAGGRKCLVTRGDSISQDDRPVPPEQFLGTVVKIERAGRVFVPSRRRSLTNRIAGSALGRSVRLLNAVLLVRRSLKAGADPEPLLAQESRA